MHYAWIIVILSFITIVTGLGTRIAFGAFINPLQESFGVSRAAVSVVATVSFIMYGLVMPVIGRWADRRGAGVVMGASLLLAAGGYLLAHFAPLFWLTGFAFGILAAAGQAGCSAIPGTVAVARWFTKRRGLAMGLLTLAMGVGQLVVTPVAIFLNANVGWRTTVLYFAIVLAVLAPVVWLLLKPAPASMDLEPYGGPAELPVVQRPEGGSWRSLGRVLRNPNFWFISLPYMVCGFTTAGMVDTHFVPFAEDEHMPQGATATAVAVMAIANSLGVLLAGYLSDRIPRRWVLAGLYSLRFFSLLFIVALKSPGALVVFAVLYGVTDFATIPPTASLSTDLLGWEGVGMAMGLVSVCHQLGASVGAFIPGYLHDATGSYNLAFLIGAATLAAAAVISLRVQEHPPAARAPLRSAGAES